MGTAADPDGRLRSVRTRAGLLPMGPGGVSRAWRRRRWTPERVLRTIGYAAAAVATFAGGVLATGTPTTSVAMSASSYRIGDGVLRSTGPGHYAGDGALVISTAPDGGIRGVGNAVVGGRHETGVCVLSPAKRQERCTFAIGDVPVAAVDTWSGNGWSRRYDDGQLVTLTATTMVPVPFAVGR